MRKATFLLVVLASIVLVSSCKKEELEDIRLEYIEPIDPENEPDRLSKHLEIKGVHENGNLPTSSNPDQVNIDHFQTSALVSNGTVLYIPFTFSAGENITGIYLQVEGASNYWNIPLEDASSLDSYVFSLGIPEFVLRGNFKVKYALYDTNSNISDPVTMLVRVVSVENACANGNIYSEQGEEGLTVKRIEMEDVAGTVQIEYQMYSLPDRMDVFYGDEWVLSTAETILSEGETPPSSVCFDGTEGYISGAGLFSFEYDPLKSKEIIIYMYGCFGQTAWDFRVYCPSSNLDCPVEIEMPKLSPADNLTIQASTEGKITTEVYVNKGDYVCVLAKGVAKMEFGGFFYNTSAFGKDIFVTSEKIYQDERLGQLLVWQGGEKYGCNPFSLKGDDCENVILDDTAPAILVGIGDYFIAENSGLIEFEINHNIPQKNEGHFDVEIYTFTRNHHVYRNCFNRCPEIIPDETSENLFTDTGNSKWVEDGILDDSFEECYHGGHEDFRGRSTFVEGCQCVYDKTTNKLMNTPNDLSIGSFDYGYFQDNDDLRLHYILDIFPHIAYLQNEPSFRYYPTTFIY